MATQTLGSLLRTGRIYVGLTQAEAAERAAIPKQRWSETERGKRPSDPAVVARMLRAVGVRPGTETWTRAVTLYVPALMVRR